MSSRENNSQVQLQGIAFPSVVRENGASIEVASFEGAKESELSSWIQKNTFTDESDRWGIIAKSKTKEEIQALTIAFRQTLRSRLRIHSGRIERIEEESMEPELCEFHLRIKGSTLELYSFSAKQRSAIFQSIREEFGEESLRELILSKDAMKSLMTEAIEISSISLTGLGNPFFNDATLSGTDPANSKTYRELMPAGEIRSFRGKFQTRSDEAGSPPLMVTVSSKCKVRFFGGQSPVLQPDIEEFIEKISNISQKREDDENSSRKLAISRKSL